MVPLAQSTRSNPLKTERSRSLGLLAFDRMVWPRPWSMKWCYWLVMRGDDTHWLKSRTAAESRDSLLTNCCWWCYRHNSSLGVVTRLGFFDLVMLTVRGRANSDNREILGNVDSLSQRTDYAGRQPFIHLVLDTMLFFELQYMYAFVNDHS